MSVFFEKLLVSLAMAILEKGLAKGSEEYKKYSDFKEAMKAAKKYSDSIKKGGPRDERRKAEDDFLN